MKKHVVEWLKKLNGAKCWGYEGITLCEKKKGLINEILKWEGGERRVKNGERIKWNNYGLK